MSLLLVLPVCEKDADLAKNLLSWICELGECSQSALLLFDPMVPTEKRASMFFLAMQGFAFAVAQEARIQPHETGWPDGPNAMFRNASVIAPNLNRGPWYFFEPDNTPMRSGWLDEIEREYAEKRAPFLGAIETEWWHSKATGQAFQKGKYLMGSAIYPWQIGQFTNRHLSVRGRPFDTEIANDVLKHTAKSDLIQNNWRSCEYRREGDVILCNKMDHDAAGESLARRVDEKCAVVHGCRDASLQSLLSSESVLPSASRCQ